MFHIKLNRVVCSLAARVRVRGREVVLVLLTGVGCVAAVAQPVTHYFDGGIRRTVTLDPELLAHFAAPPSPVSSGTAMGRTVGAGSAEPFVKLHRRTDPLPRTVGGVSSPVYREGTSPAGRLMALPGDVMIRFKPDWSDGQVRDWASAKGLTLVRKLNITGQWYLVASPAGIASLELANTLHQSGELLSATPNWWKQTVTR